MRNRLYGVVALVVMVVSMAYGAVVICSKCGYEIPPNGHFCSHCGHKMGQPVDGDHETPDAPQVPEEPRAPGETNARYPLGVDVVDAEVKLATEAYSEGDIDLAYLYLKNASSLLQLVPPGARGDRAAELVKKMDVTKPEPRSTRETCTVCSGVGRVKTERATLSGGTMLSTTARQKCLACGGRGTIALPGRVKDAKFGLARARKRFHELQWARQYERVGEADVPQGIRTGLDYRQVAALKRTSAPPCGTCVGLGKDDCSRCKGRGYFECRNKDCVGGRVTEEVKSKMVLGTMRETRDCTSCEGAGKTVCETCAGRARVLCRDCDGRGVPEACRRCQGQGVAECRRCDGSGVYRQNPCPTCKGEGGTICQSCDGDGQKS